MYFTLMGFCFVVCSATVYDWIATVRSEENKSQALTESIKHIKFSALNGQYTLRAYYHSFKRPWYTCGRNFISSNDFLIYLWMVCTHLQWIEHSVRVFNSPLEYHFVFVYALISQTKQSRFKSVFISFRKWCLSLAQHTNVSIFPDGLNGASSSLSTRHYLIAWHFLRIVMIF